MLKFKISISWKYFPFFSRFSLSFKGYIILLKKTLPNTIKVVYTMTITKSNVNKKKRLNVLSMSYILNTIDLPKYLENSADPDQTASEAVV